MNNLKTIKPVTLSERHIIEYAVSGDLSESDYERIYRMDSLTRELFEDIYSSVLDSVFKKRPREEKKTIAVRDREHLDALLGYAQEFLRVEIGGMPCRRIRKIDDNIVDLDIEINLNFLDVSNVTDMSDIFKNFDASPCPEKGWHCKVCLNIDYWDMSNVTNISHMLDGKYVEIASLDKWKRFEASCLKSSEC